jgi:surfactin family lipopeptide synthetase A
MGEKRPGLTSLQSNYLQQRLNAAQDQRASISRRPHGELDVASFGQERIWFLERLEPGTAIYHRPLHLRLRGVLNVAALEQGLQAIVRRHAPLHTTFEMMGNGLPAPVQADPIFHLRQQDLSGLDEADIAAHVETTAQAELMQPFDLTRDLMLRGLLLRLGPDEHLLLLSFHHIASDGWSDNIFLRELGILYASFVEGRPASLPALPIQYADFAAWQRAEMQGERLARHLSYWRGRLADLTSLDMPTDRPRPAVQRYRSALHRFVLSQELAASLRALSQQEGVTLYMTLLAAFQVLLYRYTGQEDIAVGTPIAGRTRPEMEGLIGLFINTLVMRSDLSGNPTFGSLLQQVRRTALEGYDHQDLPFEQLVGALRPERLLNRHPLFDVMFQLANPTVESFQWPGLAVQRRAATAPAIGFDLSLTLREQGDGLSGVVLYDRDLFDAETVERMMIHYQTLLMGIVNSPLCPVDHLPLLTEAERHQILVEWNNTETPISTDLCVHQIFEAQVCQHPERTALIYESQSLTYAELNRLANRIAHYLRSQGIGPESPVAILGDATPHFVTGMLGIFKAGGVHVPLNSTLPPQRLSYILHDTQASMLLTTGEFRDCLPDTEAEVIFLDEAEPPFAGASTENLPSLNTPNDAAYIIYTSGSTGQPKGVVVEHRSLTHYLKFKQMNDLNRPGDRSIFWGATTFDVSMSHLCGPLCCGGSIVLVSTQDRYSPARLMALACEHQVARFDTASSMLARLIEEPAFLECKYLRAIITGSEVLLPTTVEQLLSAFDIRLVNGYGPTEATVSTLHYECRRNEPHARVPIGRPIANTRIYILDKALQPVPIGVVGELYLAGIQLARGYLNAPELTAQKFVPNPFSPEENGRLYRTGDLARWLPDGNVDFLGRVDHQVKIRGVRIELGEIEANLRKHPSVQDALVVAETDPRGQGRLIAYLILRRQASINASELRRFLKQSLPDSMTPSDFVLLDQFPRTHSGKIDRKALPAPEERRMEAETDYVPPHTPIEKWLSVIWAEMFSCEQVGIYDDFFALGGNSLTVMQVLTRIFETYAIEIPIRSFFAAPTIAELTSIILQKQVEMMDGDSLHQLLTELENGSADGKI